MMGGWAFAFINTVSLGLRVHYNMKDMECLDGCSSPCKMLHRISTTKSKRPAHWRVLVVQIILWNNKLTSRRRRAFLQKNMNCKRYINCSPKAKKKSYFFNKKSKKPMKTMFRLPQGLLLVSTAFGWFRVVWAPPNFVKKNPPPKTPLKCPPLRTPPNWPVLLSNVYCKTRFLAPEIFSVFWWFLRCPMSQILWFSTWPFFLEKTDTFWKRIFRLLSR